MSKIKNYISIIIMLALIAVVGVLLLTGVLDVDEIINAVQCNKPAALLAILALLDGHPVCGGVHRYIARI